MTRVLVIEDDPQIRRFLRLALDGEGCVVQEASRLDVGVAASRLGPDLVLLDLGLPDGDGLDFIAPFRTRSRAPVIVLSARGQETDKVAALDAGADDYLVKPFEVKELEARVRALIRRDRRQVSQEVLRVGDLVLDTATLRLTRAGKDLAVSPIGLKLLTILMRESPRVVSRRDIEREVWGDMLPDSDTLRSHLYNLRKVIDKPFQSTLLHTIHNASYRLADLDSESAAAA